MIWIIEDRKQRNEMLCLMIIYQFPAILDGHIRLVDTRGRMFVGFYIHKEVFIKIYILVSVMSLMSVNRYLSILLIDLDSILPE